MSKPKKTSEKDETESFIGQIMADGEKEDDFIYRYEGSDDDADNFLVPQFYFRSGISVIDIIVGEGGFASSKISEIFGPNKSGKSELAQLVVEKFLFDNPDGIVQYFDQETALDDKKFKQNPIFRCGRLIVRKGKTMEGCFNSIKKTASVLEKTKSTRPVLYVFDSIASIETEEEAKKEIGKSTYAPQARVLSTALRKIRGILLKTNAHLLLINQIRDKPGEMFNTTDSACGNAIKFYADYRIKMVNIGGFKFKTEAGTPPDGFKIQITTVKNKRVVPMRKVEVPLLFHRVAGFRSGLSDIWSLWDAFKDHGFLKKYKSGGTYVFATEREDWSKQVIRKIDFIRIYTDSLVGDQETKKMTSVIDPSSIIGEGVKFLENAIMSAPPESDDEEDDGEDED